MLIALICWQKAHMEKRGAEYERSVAQTNAMVARSAIAKLILDRLAAEVWNPERYRYYLEQYTRSYEEVAERLFSGDDRERT